MQGKQTEPSTLKVPPGQGVQNVALAELAGEVVPAGQGKHMVAPADE